MKTEQYYMMCNNCAEYYLVTYVQRSVEDTLREPVQARAELCSRCSEVDDSAVATPTPTATPPTHAQ